jgi:hypothetical protein
VFALHIYRQVNAEGLRRKPTVRAAMTAQHCGAAFCFRKQAASSLRQVAASTPGGDFRQKNPGTAVCNPGRQEEASRLGGFYVANVRIL